MRRVLVVDDEQNLRHMLQTLLKREGYEAVGVPSVESALKELEDRPYDIVITDLRMPAKAAWTWWTRFAAATWVRPWW